MRVVAREWVRKAAEDYRTSKILLGAGEFLRAWLGFTLSRTLIQTLVQNYQRKLNTRINRIYFKKMRTKWASRSKNGN